MKRIALIAACGLLASCVAEESAPTPGELVAAQNVQACTHDGVRRGLITSINSSGEGIIDVNAQLERAELQPVYQIPGRLFCQASLIDGRGNSLPVQYEVVQVAAGEKDFTVKFERYV